MYAVWGGCSIGVGQSPSAARRERESHIVNVVPGLRPGFLSFDVRRRALAVALVLRCRRRPCNKPPRLVSLVSPVSEPLRWKWKKRLVGLDSVMSSLDSSSIDSFCAADHDFLHLPHLLKTLCNHDYHVRQINSVLDQVALFCGTYDMHQAAPGRLDPKTLMLIWDTGGSAGLTPFRSDFIDYVECEIDVRFNQGQ